MLRPQREIIRFLSNKVTSYSPKLFSTQVFDRLAKLTASKNSSPIQYDTPYTWEAEVIDEDHTNFSKETVFNREDEAKFIDLDAQLNDLMEITQAQEKSQQNSSSSDQIVRLNITKDTTEQQGDTFHIDLQQLAALGHANDQAQTKEAYTFQRGRSESAIEQEVESAIETLSTFSLDSVKHAKVFQDFVSSDSPESLSEEPLEDDEIFLTPSQIFFKENHERLIERSKQLLVHHQQIANRGSDQKGEEGEESQIESPPEWTNTKDPVIRPGKNFFWDFADAKYIEKEEIKLEAGKLPSIEQLLKILEQEHIADVSVVDMEMCGRRDICRYAIVGTAQTTKHARRVGRLLAHTILKLDVPFLNPYCMGKDHDEYINAHLGPISVHLLTQEARTRYDLENVWLHPVDSNEQFPSYWDFDPSSPAAYAYYGLSAQNDYHQQLRKEFNESCDYHP